MVPAGPIWNRFRSSLRRIKEFGSDSGFGLGVRQQRLGLYLLKNHPSAKCHTACHISTVKARTGENTWGQRLHPTRQLKQRALLSSMVACNHHRLQAGGRGNVLNSIDSTTIRLSGQRIGTVKHKKPSRYVSCRRNPRPHATAGIRLRIQRHLARAEHANAIVRFSSSCGVAVRGLGFRACDAQFGVAA